MSLLQRQRSGSRSGHVYWLRVRLLFMIAARSISYLNSIPNLILTYNRADLIDVRIVEVDADMSVEDACDVSSTLGLVSTPDSLSLATSARRHSVSRCPYTSRFGSDRCALSWTLRRAFFFGFAFVQADPYPLHLVRIITMLWHNSNVVHAVLRCECLPHACRDAAHDST